MRALAPKARGAATAALVAALAFCGQPARANPDMADDFQAVTQWLSQEIVEGLGFNAGSTFDPPREVLDKRLQPDLSLGIGHMPLNKSRFPKMQTAQMDELHPESIFPSSVMFPNLVAHMRGGLPWRMDFAIRAANMTSPPGYKISSKTTAKAQSNSIGFTLRRHFLGDDYDLPLLTLGGHYNHVYGNFLFNTKFDVNNVQGFTAAFPIQGAIQWNVNSYGLNAVLSKRYDAFIPFFGLGYNYLTGSVRVHLEADPDTDLVAPIIGESSQHPEQSQARVIFGTEYDRSWINLFFNGEVKAIGVGSGKNWIIHAGMALPFHIGMGSGTPYASSRPKPRKAESEDFVAVARAAPAPIVKRRVKPERATTYPVALPAAAAPISTRREMYNGTKAADNSSSPTLIFIQ